MSAENVEVVRAAFDHMREHGEPDWALLDPQIDTRDHDIMDAGEYRGHEATGAGSQTGRRRGRTAPWGPRRS